MTDALQEVERAFSQLPQRPAVFDRKVRESVGKWWLQSPINIEDIASRFQDRDEFTSNRNRIRIPLHEPSTAELTGEYVLYDQSGGEDSILFFDFSRRSIVRVGVDEFKHSYPAWRIRFWEPDSNPDTTPSYLTQSTSETPLETPTASGSTSETVNSATTSDEPTDFFENLRAFIEREREAERESTRQRYAQLGHQAYFEEYPGAESVTPLGREISDFGEQIIRLEITDDKHENDELESVSETYELYPGAEIFIDRVDDSTGFPVEAELFDVDGTELNVGVYWDSSNDKGKAENAFREDSNAKFAVGELVNPVSFDREVDAISEIESDDRKRDIVTGSKSLDIEESSYSHVGTELNPSQQSAARRALRANDVYCIHGPPGTGKTRTLTAIIREAVDEGRRVLACAHSNQAVDNLLVGSSTRSTPDKRSLHSDAVAGDLDIARVGSHSKNEIVTERYTDEDPWHADVVGATMSAASELASDMFDIAVIDEATQATIPSTFIPFTKATTIVLAGDHKQLPPYHSGERQTVEQPEFSLFEHLLTKYGAQVSTTLSTQYRMNEAIAAFPNNAFYDGKLSHGPRNRSWTVGSLDPLIAHDVAGPEEQTPQQSYYNRPEARVVVSEVDQLLSIGMLPEEIGVITPYSGQIGIIRSELYDSLGKSSVDGIKIDTVDSFQGGEREAVIVSFVRSNESGDIGFLGFPIEGPRRLNVALTRAQKRLVLIGDWDTLAANRPEEKEHSYYDSLRSHLIERDVFASPEIKNEHN